MRARESIEKFTALLHIAMDKTRKLSAVLSDDELFKQKALEYFTAADQNESGTLSDEEVLEVRPALAKHHSKRRCERRRCTLIPTPCSPLPVSAVS